MAQKGNSLKGSLDFSHISRSGRFDTGNSIEYTICSAVTFQVIVTRIYSTSHMSYSNEGMTQNIYIKVAKLLQTDSLNYTILFSSKNLNVRSTIMIDDNQPMKVLIKEISGGAELTSFDIDVRLDILRGTELFTSMYNDTELTDFELRGEDGSVSVHKVILANNSPVLKTMLKGRWKEVTTGTLKIPRISKETLQHLKDYMYLQKMPENKIEQLAEIASYFMMSDLKQRCTFVMLSHLKPENAFQFLALALKSNMKKLFMAILDNIKRGVIKLEHIDHWCALEMNEQMDDGQVVVPEGLFD